MFPPAAVFKNTVFSSQLYDPTALKEACCLARGPYTRGGWAHTTRGSVPYARRAQPCMCQGKYRLTAFLVQFSAVQRLQRLDLPAGEAHYSTFSKHWFVHISPTYTPVRQAVPASVAVCIARNHLQHLPRRRTDMRAATRDSAGLDRVDSGKRVKTRR